MTQPRRQRVFGARPTYLQRGVLLVFGPYGFEQVLRKVHRPHSFAKRRNQFRDGGPNSQAHFGHCVFKVFESLVVVVPGQSLSLYTREKLTEVMKYLLHRFSRPRSAQIPFLSV